MITIVARGSVRADKIADFERQAVDLVEASRAEEGNVSYDFYVDLENPAKFTFIEVWKDRGAIDHHNATSHFQDFVESTRPLFAGPLEIALCRKLT